MEYLRSRHSTGRSHMRITRMRVLAALAAVGALALAAGGALAVQGSATAAAAEIEDVIHACRHPNGGCVRREGGRKSSRVA